MGKWRLIQNLAVFWLNKMSSLGVITHLFSSTFWLSNVKGTKHMGKALVFITFLKPNKILFQVRIKCQRLN